MSESRECEPDVDPPPRVVAVEDRPFWDAIDAGGLSLARCPCGQHYARCQACFACGASARTMRWVPASGRATLLSYVVFDKAYHPYFATRLPYVVALVALDEGPEIVTNVVDLEPRDIGAGALRIGMPLSVRVTARGGQKIHEASVKR
jgi:uncharacterized OB-fold protein